MKFGLLALVFVLVQGATVSLAQQSISEAASSEPTEHAAAERLAGRYAPYAGARGSVEIVLNDGALMVDTGNGVAKLLEEPPSDVDGGAWFGIEGAPIRLRFTESASSDSYELEMHRGNNVRVLRRVDQLEAAYRAQAGQSRPHALSDAVLMGDVESAQKLLAAGADPEELDTREGIGGRSGRRPLNWAALQDDVRMVRLLLDAGASITAANRSGNTALHHAVEANAIEAARLLVASGADLEAKTRRGLTPLQMALLTQRSEIAEVLRSTEGTDCGAEPCAPATLQSVGYTAPEDHQDGLAVGSLEDADADQSLVARLLAEIEQGTYGEVHSLLVLSGGLLVVEQYYGDWDADDVHQMQSVSKSITGLLVGSAIRQGHIESVHDPISRYLPDHRQLLQGDKSALRIEDLLTMSAGFDWDEHSSGYGDPNNIRAREMRSPDSVAFTLEPPLINEPGEVFTYSGGYVTVVGEILVNATGAETVLDYLHQSTLAALEFGEVDWLKQWDSRQNTAGGLLLRPRDLAKIGQMMLDGGKWKGQRVLDAEFVEASLAKHIGGLGRWPEYGYFWWGGQFEAEGQTFEVDAAQGWGGQELLLVPALDLVVVLTAANFQVPTPTPALLQEVILPAFHP